MSAKYKLYESYELPNFTCYSQYDLSIYHKNTKKGFESEGNCVLASIYSTLAYLQKIGVYQKLPTGQTVIDTTKDSVKTTAKIMGYAPRETKVTVPTLYAKIREIALKKYGYTVMGVTDLQTDKLIQDVLKAYGYNNKPSHTTIPPLGSPQIFNTAFESTVKKNLKSGYPVIFNTYLVYGTGHCISIIGYSNYRLTYNLGIVKVYRYAKLLKVADNHIAQPTYFDYSAYMFNTNCIHFK